MMLVKAGLEGYIVCERIGDGVITFRPCEHMFWDFPTFLLLGIRLGLQGLVWLIL